MDQPRFSRRYSANGPSVGDDGGDFLDLEIVRLLLELHGREKGEGKK